MITAVSARGTVTRHRELNKTVSLPGSIIRTLLLCKYIAAVNKRESMFNFVKHVYSSSNHINSAFTGKNVGTPEAKYMTLETCVLCFVVKTVYRSICDPLSRMLLHLYLTMASASPIQNPVTIFITENIHVSRSPFRENCVRGYIVGRTAHCQNQYYLQPARAGFYRRNILP
jgi:hypothetical protein